MPSAWKPLTLQESNDVPTLLAKSSFTSSGYTVHVTDLSCVWSETLDRKQVIRRALNENTSIDPSEDASQLRILLKNIGEALSGQENTALSLVSHGGKQLVLQATAQLPAPLEPLEWTFQLGSLPVTDLRNEIILPLIVSAHIQNERMQHLILEIQDKDRVISKLLDRMESSGADIASIFPGATGAKLSKKVTAREQAAKVVKGLGVFDSEHWLRNSMAINVNDTSPDELVRKVFDPAALVSMLDTEGFQPSLKSHGWWKDHVETVENANQPTGTAKKDLSIGDTREINGDAVRKPETSVSGEQSGSFQVTCSESFVTIP